ncbi:hypothetical protein [Azospirillum doebereinerae]
MAFKPNYNQQRAERNRAKELKKQEKLQRREEEAARKAAGLPPLGDEDNEGTDGGDTEAEALQTDTTGNG